MSENKIIEVGMALVVVNNKILIAQRKKGKRQEFLWEFPGGKLEAGETWEECLKREFMEEFEKPIEVGAFFKDVTYTYDNLGTVHLSAFWATAQDESIPHLYEHETYRWVDIDEMKDFEFCPADTPFIEALKNLK